MKVSIEWVIVAAGQNLKRLIKHKSNELFYLFNEIHQASRPNLHLLFQHAGALLRAHDHLGGNVKEMLLPNDELVDAQVRMTIYDTFLTHGQPASMSEVADGLGIPISMVQESYQRLAQGHVFVLQPESGEILMANPFSSVPTAYLVEVEGQCWWGNCIWDALGILAMVGKDGRVNSSCPDCGEGLHLVVSGGELEDTSLVAHFSVPANQWWDNIVFT